MMRCHKGDDDARWHGFGWELYKHSYAQGRLGCSLEFSDETPGEIYCTALALFLPPFTPFFHGSDGSHFLSAARRMLDGETPYRDFFEFFPQAWTSSTTAYQTPGG
jgi:hypothetical protein